jgi:hypothetical protein
MAEAGCDRRFKAYVGIPSDHSVLDVAIRYPVKGSWDTDRVIVCTISQASGPTTVTLRHALR